MSFGLTTNDEMMLMFLQYTLEPPSAVVQTAISDRKEFSVNVMPNPSISSSEILFVRDYVRKNELIVLYNLLGEEIITQAFPLGEKKLYLEKNLLSPGIYIYKSMAGNILLHSGKLIVN
ncbi:MAG TPA: T9SS type A sorting domain-containing protein [Flavobacteriales bacterium]|nr:T9SS type A sorting domain-containing protein [Flavobacteriales bacterium]